MKVWLTSGILPGGARTFLEVIEGGAKYFFTIQEGGRMIFLLIIIITIICILSNMREFFQSVVIFSRCARYFIYLLK